MEPTKDQDLASATPAAEDDVIDLTDILEEGASETVIEISSKMEDLDSLDLKSLLAEEAEAEETRSPEPPEPAPKPKDESLEDLLFSLKEEPGEPAAPAVSEEEVRQQAQASLSEDRILEIVREVVRETVEKICRELFPEVASRVVNQEIEALKKSLEEEI
jgi:hypothetical protein